jgi:hypothetical protein
MFPFKEFYPDLLEALQPTHNKVLGIAWLLLLPLFAFNLIVQQMKGLSEKPEYGRTVLQLALIIFLFQIYEPFFSKSYIFFREVSREIFSDSEFAAFVENIWTGMPANQEAVGGLWGFLKGSVATFVVTLSYILCAISFYFLLIIKNTFLGFLYVVGPIWLAVSLMPGKRETLYGFIETVLLINGWTVVANILQKIIFVSVYNLSLDPTQDFLPVVGANIVLSTLLLTTPKITSMLVRGHGLGGTGALESGVRRAIDMGKSVGALAWIKSKSAFQHPPNTKGQSGGTHPGNAAIPRPGETGLESGIMKT